MAVLVALGSGGLTLALALLQVLRVARAASTAPAGESGWIVVLGTRLQEGRPGPAFRKRLRRARLLAEARPALPVVLLGGVTGRERVAEAEAGAQFLAAAGLPAERLRTETGSRHTIENLQAWRAAFAAPADRRALLLVTSRSHLARAAMMARGLGLAVLPCAAEERAGWPDAAELRRLPAEAFLLHWYVLGRIVATLTRNRAMLRRIS